MYNNIEKFKRKIAVILVVSLIFTNAFFSFGDNNISELINSSIENTEPAEEVENAVDIEEIENVKDEEIVEDEEMAENEEVIEDEEKIDEEDAEDENEDENENEDEEIVEDKEITENEEKTDDVEIVENEECEEDIKSTESEIPEGISDNDVIATNNDIEKTLLEELENEIASISVTRASDSIIYGMPLFGSSDTAMFEVGSVFNLLIKKLIDPSVETYLDTDYNIKYVKRQFDSIIYSGVTSPKIKVSTDSDMSGEIWAYFDNSDDTLYYYSDASSIYFNYDSSCMFTDLFVCEGIDISSVSFYYVKNASYMFDECYSLDSINFNQDVKTDNLEYAIGMFCNCVSLEEIDLYFIKFLKTPNISGMFYGCEKLNELIISDDWELSTLDDDKKKYLYDGCFSISYSKKDTPTDTPTDASVAYDKEFNVIFSTGTSQVIDTRKVTYSSHLTLPDFDDNLIYDGDFVCWKIGNEEYDEGDIVYIKDVYYSSDGDDTINCKAYVKYDKYYTILFNIDEKYYDDVVPFIYTRTVDSVTFPNPTVLGVNIIKWKNTEKSLEFAPGEVYNPDISDISNVHSLCTGEGDDTIIEFDAVVEERNITLNFINVKPSDATASIIGQQATKTINAINEATISDTCLELEGYTFEGFSLVQNGIVDVPFGLSVEPRDLLTSNVSLLTLYSVFDKDITESEREKEPPEPTPIPSPKPSNSSSGGGGGSYSKNMNLIKQNTTPVYHIKQGIESSKVIDGSKIYWRYNPISNTYSIEYRDGTSNYLLKGGFYTIASQDAMGKALLNAYYFDADGNMLTGFLHVSDGRIYYLDNEHDAIKGNLITDSWILVNGEWYKARKDGSLYTSCITDDGYLVDATGKWVTDSNQNSDVTISAFNDTEMYEDIVNDYARINTECDITYAQICSGYDFHTHIRNLVYEVKGIPVSSKEEHIRNIVFSEVVPDDTHIIKKDISDASCSGKVFMYISTISDTTLVICSDADVVYMPENCSAMFMNCKKLETIDLDNFDFSKTRNFSSMFIYCSELKSLSIKRKTACDGHLRFNSMFEKCQSLLTVNMVGTNFSLNKTSNMFKNCNNIETIIINVATRSFVDAGPSFGRFDYDSDLIFLRSFPSNKDFTLVVSDDFYNKMNDAINFYSYTHQFTLKKANEYAGDMRATIKYYDKDGTTVIGSDTYLIGDYFVVSASPSEFAGHNFVGWKSSPTASNPTYFDDLIYECVGNLNLYPEYVGKVVNINYYADENHLVHSDIAYIGDLYHVRDLSSINYQYNTRDKDCTGFSETIGSTTATYHFNQEITIIDDRNINLYPTLITVQRFISDIKIVCIKKGSVMFYPTGYKIIPTDMKSGFGKNSMYIAYKLTTDINDAITDIRILNNNHAATRAPVTKEYNNSVYNLVYFTNGDKAELMAGTGKKIWKYMYTTKSPVAGKPITELVIQVYGSGTTIGGDRYIHNFDGGTDNLNGNYSGKPNIYICHSRYQEKYYNGKAYVTPKNWMSFIDNSTNITAINVPGTHDSGCENVVVNGTSLRTQYLSIRQQLDAGARIFDIRVGNNGAICHGPIKTINPENSPHFMYLDDVLAQMTRFLAENNSETIIARISKESGTADNYVNSVKKSLAKFEKQLYLNNTVPSLGKIYTGDGVRGKIVVYNGRDYYNASLDFGKGIIWNFKGETNNAGWPKELVDYNSGGKVFADEKISILNKYFSVIATKNLKDIKYTGNDVYVDCSCFGRATKPKGFFDLFKQLGLLIYTVFSRHDCAKKVNKFILSYPFVKGRAYGWIGMDFIDYPIMKKIYETNLQ